MEARPDLQSALLRLGSRRSDLQRRERWCSGLVRQHVDFQLNPAEGAVVTSSEFPSLLCLSINRYILYKAPEQNVLTGLEYIYMDSGGKRKMSPASVSPASYKPINHPQGVLANTLRPLFTPIRSMVRILPLPQNSAE